MARVEELANYDAIMVGTGTRFGRMSGQMSNFLGFAGQTTLDEVSGGARDQGRTVAQAALRLHG